MADSIYDNLTKGLYRIQLYEPSYEIPAEQIASGSLLASFNQVMNVIQSGKTHFDNTEAGYILGVDDGVAKFYIGDTSSYINWDGSTLTISGGLSVSSIDIPDTITANSFHVDVDGNAWWGATTLAGAVAKVLKTGVATFTDIVATGTINATGGYIGTTTALVYESQGISVGTTGYIRGNQTDYNTGTGFFLGYSGGAYKFSIGVSTGNFLTWDGTNLSMSGKINKLAGEILYQSANTTRSSPVTDYTVRKQITVYQPGTYRVKFTIWVDATSTPQDSVAGKIYKNGVAIDGTENINNSATPTEYSEDISGIVSGDVIELYMKFIDNGGSATNASCSNFRLYVSQYDYSVVTTD
jgi:hypothetical protein